MPYTARAAEDGAVHAALLAAHASGEPCASFESAGATIKHVPISRTAGVYQLIHVQHNFVTETFGSALLLLISGMKVGYLGQP